jgi:hypothetical protein
MNDEQIQMLEEMNRSITRGTAKKPWSNPRHDPRGAPALADQ